MAFHTKIALTQNEGSPEMFRRTDRTPHDILCHKTQNGDKKVQIWYKKNVEHLSVHCRHEPIIIFSVSE